MTTKPDLTFEHTYSIRSYEPRMDGHVSIATVCNHLQDMASRHADSMGFGFHDLEKSGHVWLLARLHVMMERLPGYGERSRVLTWPSGNERLVANRDFLIHDETRIIGRATTSWVTMNLATHKPDEPATVLNKRFIPEIDRALIFPSRAVQRLKEGEHTTITARKADTDINGHVNNVRYTEFCLEAVPDAWCEENHCLGIDIQFRNESFAGDEIISSYTPLSEPDDAMSTMIHNLTRPADNAEIVRMKSWWTKK